MPLFTAKPLIGVDIVENDIQLTKLKLSKSKITLEKLACLDLPAGVIENGEIKQPAEIILRLKNWVALLRVENFRAAFALPAQHAISKRLKLPGHLTEEECEAEISEYLNQYFPTISDDLCFDFIIAEKKEQDEPLDVQVFAAKKAQIHPYVHVLNEAGLLVKRVGVAKIDSMAGINLLPWRVENRAKEKWNNKLSIVIGVLLGLVALIFAHEGFNFYLIKLNKKISILENALNEMQPAVDKTMGLKKQYEILARQLNHSKMLENKLRRSQKELSELDSMVTRPVMVSAIMLAKNLLTMKGETDSIEKLQLFVTQLDQLNYFSEVQLKEIKKLPRAKNFYFTLIANAQGDEHGIN